MTGASGGFQRNERHEDMDAASGGADFRKTE